MRTLACLALVAVLNAACEGGGGSTTGPSSSPYNQTQTGNVAVYGITRHAVNVTRGGNLTVRLSWQDGAVDLDLYLAPSSCVELYPLGHVWRPRHIGRDHWHIRTSRTVGEQRRQLFMLFVDNMSTTQEQNYTLTIGIQ